VNRLTLLCGNRTLRPKKRATIFSGRRARLGLKDTAGQASSGTARGQESVLDAAIAKLWPSACACGKIVARDNAATKWLLDE